MEARQRYPVYHFAHANAEQLEFEAVTFDFVLLFTVMSSILDEKMANNVAREIRRVLKPGGAVVWYDLRYSNPINTNVRGLNRSAIRALFPRFAINVRTVTVLPPLGRRLGAGDGPALPSAYTRSLFADALSRAAGKTGVSRRKRRGMTRAGWLPFDSYWWFGRI